MKSTDEVKVLCDNTSSDYIYYDGTDFIEICEDSYYSHPIKYCPWCGKKLE